MFLSKRERPSDTPSASTSPSHIAYKRTSIPSINVVSLFASASSAGSSAQRRAPLAPLDPQLASTSSLDDQMAPASAHTTSRSDRSQRLDSSRDGDVPRSNVGRQIMAWPLEDDESNIPSLRKRSIPNHNSLRSLPYPPRSTQRRPSNTPSLNSTRRPSIPNALNSSQNTPPSALSPQPTQSLSDPGLYGGDDIYSGLSTFTFGAAKVIPIQMSDSSDMISPLTRVAGSGSADRTPRPSISGVSGGRRKSYSSKVSDPAEGDDEYEDEDDDARGKARSKMRAIDDGTRRPSLPTNSLAAISTATTPPASSPSNADSETSPISRSSHESEFESSEPEGDDGDAAEFDTDVELDMSHDHHSSSSLDPPISDAASQRTFGVGSFDHYGYWRSPADGQSRSHEDDDEEDEPISISPVTFKHEDEEGYDDGARPLPSLVSSRRGSMPLETLSPRSGTSGRDREDSAMTIIASRGSRSVENLTTASPEPLQSPRRDTRPLDAHDGTSAPDDGAAPNDEFQYGPYDLNYILSGVESRKSWSSGSASYVQSGGRRASGDPYSLAQAWDTELFRSGRRPSTVTIGSSEDAFTRHVRALDPDYNVREERWSFKKENSDGRGPHRMQLTTSAPQTPNVPTSHTMMPQTQEIWRQEFVGRYKVDRLKISSESRGKAKAPQQRVHVRHIPDPYLKGNVRGGPHAVIHKHSRVVAFSLFRHNNVLPPHTRKDRSSLDRSGVILLANKKVQEAYTSTHTTSQLNSHGLLAEPDGRTYDGATMVGTTLSNTGHSRPSTPGHSDASVRRRGQASSSVARDSASPPPPPSLKKRADGVASSSSPAAVSAALEAASSSDYSASAGPSSSLKTRSSTVFSQDGRTRFDPDSDDSDSPPRTSHAEAFATVDSSYYEAMRARAAQRHTEDPQPISKLSAFRKLFGPQRNASSHGSGSSPAQREGNYIPPWVVLAPRSKQEESRRVIQNLNESFQDVGLLPTNTKSTSRSKGHKGKGRQDRRERQPGSILEKVPKDSLYMLLPLWPGEVYPASKANEDISADQLRVEDRQYLLVYYVPFEEKEKRKTDHNKKRSRGSKSPTVSASSSAVDLPLFFLRSFRVNARLVSYDDLRGTGVRVPSYGLTVTGTMAEAMRYLPSPSIREQRLDEVVICQCTSRNSGMKFDPDGLSKLGLCMPTETPAAMQIPDSVIPEPEEAILTPIGRAAVEMAWLGCMAATSFGTV